MAHNFTNSDRDVRLDFRLCGMRPTTVESCGSLRS